MIQKFRQLYNGCSNVQFNFNTYFDLITNKCLKIFEWENLPYTINPRILEELLILTGKCCFTKINNKYYCLNGNVGGEVNVYYEPTRFITNNPILGSLDLKVRQLDGGKEVQDLDGVLICNSDVDYLSEGLRGGLSDLIYQTAGLLADNISSLNIAQINSRVSLLFTADSQTEAETGEQILKDIYSGKPYRILSQNILEKYGVNPVAQAGQSNTVMTLIEARRSILQDFFNEIGLGYQGNVKRERVNSAEIGLMKDSLDINVQSMLKSREAAVEQINELYGLNITVRLNPNVYTEEAGEEEEELQVDGVIEDKVEDIQENVTEEENKNEQIEN